MLRTGGTMLAAALGTAAALAGMVAAAPAQAQTARIDERFDGYARATWLDDGARLGPWRVVFDGVSPGKGVRLAKGGIQLSPQPVSDPADTQSTLVVSRTRFSAAPLHVNATWTAQRTTRAGTPNPWETGWLIWDYVDPAHFTYLILKPNGWEVGRRDPAEPGGQRFLADGPSPATPIGVQRTASVDRDAQGVTSIRVDGQPLTSLTLPASEIGGAVGMYAEDAVVSWTRLYATGTPR